MAGRKTVDADRSRKLPNSVAFNESAGEDLPGSGKTGLSSTPTAKISLPEGVASGSKEFSKQTSLDGHGSSQASSCYSYYYPGFDGSSGQVGDAAYYHTDGLQTVTQSETGQVVAYYWPGYNPYATGNTAGADEQGISAQQYYSSGYLQPSVSYGLDSGHYYSWNPTYAHDVSSPENISGPKYSKPVSDSTAFMHSAEQHSMRTKSGIGSQSSRSLRKVPQPNLTGSDNSGVFRGYDDSARRNLTFDGQRHGVYNRNYRLNGRGWNPNDRYRKVNTENSMELISGPRSLANTGSPDSLIKDENFGFAVQRDKYNRADFQEKYENAKFFIIKSYSEDDIHKCVKYDVWSSTPNGNKKLDAAFNDVQAAKLQNNSEYPIFLFFSVNGSGQFVGVAEMVGHVDFEKDMDFWQVDKWSGFFPVRWHIIKDVPNIQLRHIILENNDNQSVTFSRDTQEVGLRQGLEMLNIFKTYSARTSLLDDFSFYDNREKSLKLKKNKPATLRMNIFDEDDSSSAKEAAAAAGERNNANSLVNLTKNLSLSGSPVKLTTTTTTSGVTNHRGHSSPFFDHSARR